MQAIQVNEQALGALQLCLSQTLDPRTQRQAEQSLVSFEREPNFSVLLFRTIADDKVDQTIRFAAALFFKNYVKRNWEQDEEEASKIAPNDRLAIKSQIVDLMIAVPEKLQLQLSEALSFIASYDFPHKWETLLPQLISKLNTSNYTINNGVLQTAHSIFKRWRSLFRSDALFTEINYVLGQFAQPYLDLFKTTDALIDQNANSPEVLPILMQSLLLMVKIFIDFNSQDLPEFFEDHIKEFMSLLYKYLKYSNPLLETNDDNEAGLIEKVKANICEIVGMYSNRYTEEFTMFQEFIQITWFLLTSIGIQTKYDVLVSHAMAVLTSAVKKPHHRAIFANEDTLKQFCEKIVLPNMILRESDQELFEDDPIEFIRRDLEGSDNDTRRRAAADFVGGLMEQFEKQITDIILSYIQHYMQRYNMNPSTNWIDKDAALSLLSAIAVRNVAQQHGATRVNDHINVIEFFQTSVIPDLQPSATAVHPILEVDAIKYLYTFRSHLPKELLLAAFPLLVNHLVSTNFVVYTYSAITIERILFIRQGKDILFSQADVKPFTEVILGNLFKLIQRGTTPEKLAENDYLMKTVMRVIITTRSDVIPYVNAIMQQLTVILGVISKNPSNPRFNHYVFESIGALIRFTCPASPNAITEFENMLFPIFTTILIQDIQEFNPYVFQLLSQLLEYHNEGGLPQSYQGLFPPLVQPAPWDQHGNIPPLVRLLQAYLAKAPDYIIANNHLNAILGIFQRLCTSRMHDFQALYLLESIVKYIPMNALAPSLKAIFTLVLTKLQSKTSKETSQILFDKFTRGFVYFTCIFMALDHNGLGPDVLVQTFDSIQQGLFSQILKFFILPDLLRLHDSIQRKVGAIGFIRLLTQSQIMLVEPYVNLWAEILSELLRLISEPQKVENDDDEELYAFDLEESGYQVSFSKLTTASQLKVDPMASITDVKVYLMRSLEKLSLLKPGFVPGMLMTLQSAPAALLSEYIQETGIGPFN